MRVQGKVRSGLFVFSLVLAGGGASALAATPNPSMTGAAAHPAHSTQALPAALRPVFYEALAKDAGADYHINNHGCAVLPKQTLKACFDDSGAHFTGAGSPLALRLTGWGRGNDLASVTAVRPIIKANEASYAHGHLTEWWRVLPVGFEQGFTIAKRPSGSGELTLALAASRQDAGAPKNGSLTWGKLRYGQLVVTDAKGKIVPATLTTIGNQVLIAVNDAHAAYPLTVDPLLWVEQKVTASNGAAYDQFGWSVAISGPTAIVGAWNVTVGANSGQGAAYVFTESNGIWTQTAELTASNGAANDQFGMSVAVSGQTAIVCAPPATIGGNPDQGAAYVFTKSGNAWPQTQILTANNGAANDYFCQALALDGTTALFGVPQRVVSGNPSQGAVYVFNESGGTWTQTQMLTASNGAPGDQFGMSVAVSGPAAIIGAATAMVGQGEAYVFTLAGGLWTQSQILTASNGAANDQFGYSVAVFDPIATALVGANQAAAGGASNEGAVYVFIESGGMWNQTQILTASDGAPYDEFGWSVALNHQGALVGAPSADVGPKTDQGAAYVFKQVGSVLTQTAKLNASDGAGGDGFGWSVALRIGGQEQAIVGTPLKKIGTNLEQGAAYLYGPNCPPGYTSYSGPLSPNQIVLLPPYPAPGGVWNVILTAPAGFLLGIVSPPIIFPSHVVSQWGPAGTYTWGVKANPNGGAARLCINPPPTPP